MNDLLQTMDLSEGQWSSSTDHLEARDEAIGSQHRKEFGSMDYASLTLTFTRGARQRSDTGTFTAAYRDTADEIELHFVLLTMCCGLVCRHCCVQ